MVLILLYRYKMSLFALSKLLQLSLIQLVQLETTKTIMQKPSFNYKRNWWERQDGQQNCNWCVCCWHLSQLCKESQSISIIFLSNRNTCDYLVNKQTYTNSFIILHLLFLWIDKQSTEIIIRVLVMKLSFWAWHGDEIKLIQSKSHLVL